MSISKLESFRYYVEKYVDQMFGVELTEENFDYIINYSGNERHKYPLYFIWIIPGYKSWYLTRDGLDDYMVLGRNFLNHMLSLPQYNSHFVEHLFANAKLPPQLSSKLLLSSAKIRLGRKAIYMLEGSQKFIWSWASYMESYGKELSAGSASVEYK